MSQLPLPRKQNRTQTALADFFLGEAAVTQAITQGNFFHTGRFYARDVKIV